MSLFRPSLRKEVLNDRYVIVNTTVNEDELHVINQKITDSIRSSQTDKIVMGGDFQFCPLSASDKFGAGTDIQFLKSVMQLIDELRYNYDIVDPWREQHPHDTQFTWRNSSGKIKCRLGFWLFSKHLRRRRFWHKNELHHQTRRVCC